MRLLRKQAGTVACKHVLWELAKIDSAFLSSFLFVFCCHLQFTFLPMKYASISLKFSCHRYLYFLSLYQSLCSLSTTHTPYFPTFDLSHFSVFLFFYCLLLSFSILSLSLYIYIFVSLMYIIFQHFI